AQALGPRRGAEARYRLDPLLARGSPGQARRGEARAEGPRRRDRGRPVLPARERVARGSAREARRRRGGARGPRLLPGGDAAPRLLPPARAGALAARPGGGGRGGPLALRRPRDQARPGLRDVRLAAAVRGRRARARTAPRLAAARPRRAPPRA